MTTIQEIAAIRKAIKATVPTVSVKANRGTSYGWVGIRGSGEWGMFTPQERAGLTALGLNCGGNYAVISPEVRGAVLRRLTA
jgi:hypothetical protein